MSITVGRLHKILSRAIELGHVRKKVCISKDTFTHPLECDGATILEVEFANLESFPMLDDNGFTKFRADGTESCHTAFVLAGSSKEAPHHVED